MFFLGERRKIYFSAQILIILLALSLIVTGCASEHSHSYEEIERKEATCVDSGFIKYRCRGCSDEYSKTIAPTGHMWKEVKEESITADALYECNNCKEMVSVELQLPTMDEYKKNLEKEQPSLFQSFDFSASRKWDDGLGCYSQIVTNKQLNQLWAIIYTDEKGRVFRVVESLVARLDQLSGDSITILVAGLYNWGSCLTNGYGERMTFSMEEFVDKVFSIEKSDSDGVSRCYIDGFQVECSTLSVSNVYTLMYELKNTVSAKDLLNKGKYTVVNKPQPQGQNSESSEMVYPSDRADEQSVDPTEISEGAMASTSSSTNGKEDTGETQSSSSTRPTAQSNVETQTDIPTSSSSSPQSSEALDETTGISDTESVSPSTSEASTTEETRIEPTQHVHSDSCRIYVVDIPHQDAVFENVKVIDSPHQDAVYGDVPIQYTDYEYSVTFGYTGDYIAGKSFPSTAAFNQWVAESGATLDGSYSIEGWVTINGQRVRFWATKKNAYTAVRYEYGIVTPEQPEKSHIEKVLISPEVQEQGHWEYTCGY